MTRDVDHALMESLSTISTFACRVARIADSRIELDRFESSLLGQPSELGGFQFRISDASGARFAHPAEWFQSPVGFPRASVDLAVISLRTSQSSL